MASDAESLDQLVADALTRCADASAEDFSGVARALIVSLDAQRKTTKTFADLSLVDGLIVKGMSLVKGSTDRQFSQISRAIARLIEYRDEVLSSSSNVGEMPEEVIDIMAMRKRAGRG